MSTPAQTKQTTIDGIPLSVDDTTLAVLDKLQKGRDELQAKLDAETSARAADAKTHAETLAARDAEIKELKDNALTVEDIDKRAAERATLIDTAKPILGSDFEFTGKDDAAIRTEVAVKFMGDEAIRDKPTDYINAMYDMAVKKAKDSSGSYVETSTKSDPFVPNVHVGDTQTKDHNATRAKDLSSAWQRKSGTA